MSETATESQAAPAEPQPDTQPVKAEKPKKDKSEMKVGRIVVNQAALVEALGIVGMATATRTPRPQFQCIRLEAKKKSKACSLTLYATDAEVAIEVLMDDVDVIEEGACLVPAGDLRAIVAAQFDETLKLELSRDGVVVRASDGVFSLPGYDPADLPPMPVIPNDDRQLDYEIPVTHITHSLRLTEFAAGSFHARFAISGVCFKFASEIMTVASSDGNRVSVVTHPLEGCEATTSFILGLKATSAIRKLLSGTAGSIRLASSSSMVKAMVPRENGHVVIASNLIEGTFVPYDQVIPKDNPITLKISGPLLLSALKRAAILTSEETRGLRFTFDPEKKTLSLASRAVERGGANVECPLAEYGGPALEIGFKAVHLIQVLEALDTDQVSMELSKPNLAGMIRGERFVYVFMPINLD